MDTPDATPHRVVDISQAVLEKNDRMADQNRALFAAKGLLVMNLLSSPGSGKTALLERTAAETAGLFRSAVIVGDLQTDNDARRLANAGARALQIVTGDICHLDASMIARAIDDIDLDQLDVLIIENVGNLVCPSSYDLGERVRVVLLSVTEGEDKPLKYPTIFHGADIVLVTKIDLADAVAFDRETALANIRRVAPAAEILEVSARSGHNIDSWYRAIQRRRTGGSSC